MRRRRREAPASAKAAGNGYPSAYRHRASSSTLQRDHPGAAASIREGLAETLTVQRLGLTSALQRTLRSCCLIGALDALAPPDRVVADVAPPEVTPAETRGLRRRIVGRSVSLLYSCATVPVGGSRLHARLGRLGWASVRVSDAEHLLHLATTLGR